MSPNLVFNLSFESCDKLTFPVKSILVFGFNSNNAVASTIALFDKFITKFVLFFNVFNFSKSSLHNEQFNSDKFLKFVNLEKSITLLCKSFPLNDKFIKLLKLETGFRSSFVLQI